MFPILDTRLLVRSVPSSNAVPSYPNETRANSKVRNEREHDCFHSYFVQGICTLRTKKMYATAASRITAAKAGIPSLPT